MNIIFLSEAADQVMLDYMQTLGVVVQVPKDERFDDRISSHPDLVISILDQTLIIDQNAPARIFQQLDALEVPYVLGNTQLAAVYPGDIAYNAVITDHCFIHNLDYTTPLLLQHSKYTGKKLIHVKQGYTKCSTVVVEDNALITSDPGIYQAAKEHMDILLVEPGHVALKGYDYGFLGGASASFEDQVVFHGDLSQHPDYPRILAFVEAANKKLVYFKEFPLTDIGSVLVYRHNTTSQQENNKQKNHVNIPIFISHEGCPNDCVFCNQRKITAKATPMTFYEVTEQIATYRSTLEDQTYTELAFFGGSFTGIDSDLQESYLKLAHNCKKSGKIHSIRLSTRPDYISTDILDRLKYYEVDTIELGVQSLQEEVLEASNRGNQVADVYKAVEQIKAYGFHLGIQLMVGLPKDTKDKAILSAQLAALLKPDFVRIYPTLVIKETELSVLCQTGVYHPLSLEEAADWTKEMYRVFLANQIPVIRIGLQPTDLITEGKDVLAGPFHPAFRQLVEGAYFLELMQQKLTEQGNLLSARSDIRILCNPKDLSQVIGHHRKNLLELQKEYPMIKVIAKEGIRPMRIECVFL